MSLEVNPRLGERETPPYSKRFLKIPLRLQLWAISTEISEKRVTIRQGHSPHKRAVQQSPHTPQKLHGFSLCYLQCSERHHICSWIKTWSQTGLRNKMKACRNTEVLIKRIGKSVSEFDTKILCYFFFVEETWHLIPWNSWKYMVKNWLWNMLPVEQSHTGNSATFAVVLSKLSWVKCCKAPAQSYFLLSMH